MFYKTISGFNLLLPSLAKKFQKVYTKKQTRTFRSLRKRGRESLNTIRMINPKSRCCPFILCSYCSWGASLTTNPPPPTKISAKITVAWVEPFLSPLLPEGLQWSHFPSFWGSHLVFDFRMKLSQKIKKINQISELHYFVVVRNPGGLTNRN